MIRTKFICATDTRGSRVKATCEWGSMSMPYDHSINSFENHERVAKALAQKHEQVGEWMVESNRTGYYFFRACIHAFTITREVPPCT